MAILKYWKLIALVLAVASLVAFVYMWRSEIIKGVQSAYVAVLNEKTLQKNEESRKEADNVRREEQSLDSITLDRNLCALDGLVRGSKGCNRH